MQNAAVACAGRGFSRAGAFRNPTQAASLRPLPTSRLILLGASNVARGCLALTDAARAAAGGPVEVHAALGRGRSFGIPSRLLIRQLGGIEASPIWDQLAAAPALPTNALVMDVGNDLFYGVEVPQILAWVDVALQRLTAHAARVTLVGIPLASLRRLSPALFAVFRHVLVPSCRLSLRDGLVQAEQLHHGLQQLAERHGATFVTPQDDWYGLDPIHIRRRHWDAAARTLLGVPADTDAGAPPLDRWSRRLSFFFAAPAQRRWPFWTQRHSQPARTFPDGSTISLW